MIEVILDFSELFFKEKEDEREKITKLIGYLNKKLNLPWEEGWRGVWDAFSDNFSDLFNPEIPKDYKFSMDDEWGWSSYDDYLLYINNNKEIGHKNEEGYRDDLKLVLVNFYDFHHRNKEIAEYFIHVLLFAYSSMKNNQWNDPVLGFELDIKS